MKVKYIPLFQWNLALFLNWRHVDSRFGVSSGMLPHVAINHQLRRLVGYNLLNGLTWEVRPNNGFVHAYYGATFLQASHLRRLYEEIPALVVSSKHFVPCVIRRPSSRCQTISSPRSTSLTCLSQTILTALEYGSEQGAMHEHLWLLQDVFGIPRCLNCHPSSILVP